MWLITQVVCFYETSSSSLSAVIFNNEILNVSCAIYFYRIWCPLKLNIIYSMKNTMIPDPELYH